MDAQHRHARPRRAWRGGALCLALIASVLSANLATAASKSSAATLSAEQLRVQRANIAVSAQLAPTIAALAARVRAADPYYFSANTFNIGTSDCFRCAAGPALSSAVYAGTSGNKVVLARVVSYFDQAIARNQAANGSFAPKSSSPDIETTMFANALGATYLVLGARLNAAHRTAWRLSVVRAADFLVKNKNLSWYTNGNIVLANALTMALAFKLSGQVKYKTLTAQATQFALAPPQVRWKGQGLKYTKLGTRADGADSAGYLTETGKTTGFDADYTQVQLDVTTWWFLLTGDRTALRLTNILFNGLRSRINLTNWHLDTSGGTRHPQTNRWIWFNSSALVVLARRAGRTDLAPYVASQSRNVVSSYLFAETRVNNAEAWGFGSQLAPTMMTLSR
jgi:hypothetical protein